MDRPVILASVRTHISFHRVCSGFIARMIEIFGRLDAATLLAGGREAGSARAALARGWNHVQLASLSENLRDQYLGLAF